MDEITNDLRNNWSRTGGMGKIDSCGGRFLRKQRPELGCDVRVN